MEKKEPNYKFATAPLPEWGAIVSMVIFRDRLLIACENMVVELKSVDDQYVTEPIQIANDGHGGDGG